MEKNQIEILIDFDVVWVFASGGNGGSDLFSAVSEAGVTVDLISMTREEGQECALSFSVFSRDFSKVLKAMAGLKKKGNLLKFRVQGGFGKITLRGNNLPEETGIAADFFKALSVAGAETPLISSSDISISVLLKAEELDKTLSSLECFFPQALVVYQDEGV